MPDAQACNGVVCGTASNGCGGTVQCTDTCATGDKCYPNNACCTPNAQACQGKTCGSVSDGCNDMVSCGTCAAGEQCTNDNCVACTLPDCTTIPCGNSVTVCGEVVVSCASGCAG